MTSDIPLAVLDTVSLAQAILLDHITLFEAIAELSPYDSTAQRLANFAKATAQDYHDTYAAQAEQLAKEISHE